MYIIYFNHNLRQQQRRDRTQVKPSDGAVNSIEMWPIAVIELPNDHPLISHLQQTNPLATIPRLIDHQNNIPSIQFLAQLFCHQLKTT